MYRSFCSTRFSFWKSLPSSSLGLARYVSAFESATEHRASCQDKSAIIIHEGTVVRTTEARAKERLDRGQILNAFCR